METSASLNWPIRPKPALPEFPVCAAMADVLVLPASRRRGKGLDPDGGPILSNAGGSLAERLAEPAVFAGHLDRHFGHFTSEHLPHIPVILQQRPQDMYLFTVDPDMDGVVPGWFFPLLAWYGLRAEQVRFVEAPLLCTELRRPAPEETLLTEGPSADYLQLLDQIALRNGLVPDPAKHLYVSRTEMLRDGMGGHLGESYLVDCLGKLGVRVMDPASLSYRDQLAAYAGADHVIFAEGSAQHARQGLGFVRQTITVLNRRPNTNMGDHLLEPRCKRLSFVESSRALAFPNSRQGLVLRSFGMAFYDVPVLFAAFRAAGIKLNKVWDDAAFQAAVKQDAKTWVIGRRRHWGPRIFDETTAPMIPVLRREGLAWVLKTKVPKAG